MVIGEYQFNGIDDVTVTVRAFTLLNGERVTRRLMEGWASIPAQLIVELTMQFIDDGPLWTVNDLRIVSMRFKYSYRLSIDFRKRHSN